MIHMKFSSPALMGQPVRMTITQGRVSRDLSIDAFGVGKTPPGDSNGGGAGEEVIVPPPSPPPGSDTATLTISVRRGQQQIAPEGIAFFAEVSGFDAQPPTDGSVYDPTMHEIAYGWTFGDPGQYTAPQNMLPEWRNSNVAYGPFPSHVFTRPGTYPVNCIAVQNGKIATGFVEVTVQDPNVVCPPATTVVCSTAGNFAGMPAHDAANRTTSWAAAFARLQALKNDGRMTRLVFRGGEEHVVTANTSLDNKYRNIHISSHGPGKAIVRASSIVFTTRRFPLVPGASISGLEVIGPWNSTTETVADGYTLGNVATAFSIIDGFATFHDCHTSGVNATFVIGNAPDITAIIANCSATNWCDYGVYVGGQRWAGMPEDEPYVGYTGFLGCRFAQDVNALQGANGKNDADPGNRHGPIRMEAAGWHYIDVFDGFSRNGWSGPVSGVPADQPAIRDMRNNPKSKGFFTRIVAEGGQGSVYTSGPNTPSANSPYKPCNTVLDKIYLMGSARTSIVMKIGCGATTVRNAILHRPNIGTGADGSSVGLQIGMYDHYDPANFTEPANIYNVTIVNELDETQQARNSGGGTGWEPTEFRNGFNPGMIRVENIVVHRPNFPGGAVADAPLSAARLGIVPRYLGYRWKQRGNLAAKLTMDSSFATPANPWSLWRPQARSAAIGSATGLVAHDDLLGKVRPVKASRGAIEPA